MAKPIVISLKRPRSGSPVMDRGALDEILENFQEERPYGWSSRSFLYAFGMPFGWEIDEK